MLAWGEHSSRPVYIISVPGQSVPAGMPCQHDIFSCWATYIQIFFAKITLLQQLWQTVLMWNLYPIFISLNQLAVKITPAESFLWMHLHQFQYLYQLGSNYSVKFIAAVGIINRSCGPLLLCMIYVCDSTKQIRYGPHDKPGTRLNIKTVFPRYGIPTLKIRRSRHPGVRDKRRLTPQWAVTSQLTDRIKWPNYPLQLNGIYLHINTHNKESLTQRCRRSTNVQMCLIFLYISIWFESKWLARLISHHQ